MQTATLLGAATRRVSSICTFEFTLTVSLLQC